MEEITEEEEGEGDVEKTCPAIIKSGDNKGKVCGKKAKYAGKCGNHRTRTKVKKDDDDEETSIGVSHERKIDTLKLNGSTYVCNVKGSSKDPGAWKTFWSTHSGCAYPRTCMAKDCQKKATATGHMYLREEYELYAERGELPKYNYLVPICSHHNSKVYDVTFFLLKKTTVAVKILENKSIHRGC